MDANYWDSKCPLWRCMDPRKKNPYPVSNVRDKQQKPPAKRCGCPRKSPAKCESRHYMLSSRRSSDGFSMFFLFTAVSIDTRQDLSHSPLKNKGPWRRTLPDPCYVCSRVGGV